MEDPWNLSQEERDAVVSRAAHGISSLCFFSQGESVSDEVALAAAQSAEKKAFSRAKVESQTTTGHRPRAEIERAYLRILSQAIMEHAKNACADITNAGDAFTGQTLDLSHTGREFMTAELATELLAPMMAPGAQVAAIKLSTKSIGADAESIVASAILNVKATLRDADISDIIAGRPEAEVMHALRTVAEALAQCELDSLNVSDNALGEKGIRACSAALQGSPSLHALYLQNIGCSVNACAAVLELTASCALQKLHLFNNMSDNAGAVSIAKLLDRNPTMQDFKMVSSRVGPDGGSALLTALARGNALRDLDLSDNPITAGFAPSLQGMLTSQSQLTRLVFNDTCLQDEGVIALARALAPATSCPLLEVLELALNEMTPASTPFVAAALASKPHLRIVNLSENEIECAGAVHIAYGLRGAAKLQRLDMKTNQIGRVGAVALANACASGKASMELLELDDNQISDTGIGLVKTILEAAFPGTSVLGSLEENDEDGDPDDDGVEEEAIAQISEAADDLDLDLGKLSVK